MASNLFSAKTTLTSEDFTELNELMINDLISNGIDPDNVSLLSPVGMLQSFANTWFTGTKTVIDNLARESSLITAQNNSSLYMQLVQVTNDIILCTPSKLEVFVKIPIKEIERLGKQVHTDTWELEYSNLNQCVIDEKIFVPTIETHYLRLQKKDGRRDVRIFYRNKEGTAVNISTQRATEYGQSVVAFKAEFRQITLEVKEFTFTDRQLDKFIVTSDNPIHDFSLYYQQHQGAPWQLLGKRLYFTRGSATMLEYKILSNRKLSIEHKYTNGGFQPIEGGKLRVIMETTTGQNVKYKGQAEVGEVDPLDLRIEYLPIKSFFESKGGRLAPDNKEDLRNTIIKLKGSRRRIDTESDVGTFLLNYEGSSKFQPIFTVNDVKARICNIYSILSFKSLVGESVERTFTIPTNSGTTVLSLSDLPSKDIVGETWRCIMPSMMIYSVQNKDHNSFVYDPSKQKIPVAPKMPIRDTRTQTEEQYQKLFAEWQEQREAFKQQESDKYYYCSPFIYSYHETENFCRTYLDGQIDEPYICYSHEEIEHEHVVTRFINASLRMNDFEEEDGQRKFYVETEIRADSEDFEILEGKNFKALLRVKNIKNEDVVFPAEIIDEKMDQKYLLRFHIKTDRKVFGKHFAIQYTGEDKKHPSPEVEHILPVKQKVYLELYTAKEKDDPDEGYHDMIKVSTFATEFQFFKDVTASVFIQTNMNRKGLMEFVLLPLVSYDFYEYSQNKKEILQELENIFDFLKLEVYDPLDVFSKRGFTLDQLQETNFSLTIKFAKTYGRSKFLNVGNNKTVPIRNLQLKPSFFLRKIDEEFDISSIASALNEILIKHDYLMSDIHMSDLVKDVLNNASLSIQHIQFLNFDEYPSDYHLIKRNDVEMLNEDVPEVVSIAPKYNKELGIYQYDMEFKDL